MSVLIVELPPPAEVFLLTPLITDLTSVGNASNKFSRFFCIDRFFSPPVLLEEYESFIDHLVVNISSLSPNVMPAFPLPSAKSSCLKSIIAIVSVSPFATNLYSKDLVQFQFRKQWKSVPMNYQIIYRKTDVHHTV